MGDLTELLALAAAIGAAVLLLMLAWSLGVTSVRAVRRARRSVEEMSARVALLEREVRGELPGATAGLEPAGAALERMASG